MRREDGLSTELTSESLYNEFLSTLDYSFQNSKGQKNILDWVQGINFTGGVFTLEGHEWQKEILLSDHPKICIKKAAQIGATAIFILKILYNLVAGKYPQGSIVVMPTVDSVINYSKSRFAPLIDDNERIRKLVSSTDSATLKRVRKSFLHFVGGQLTSNIEKGLKKSSTALKSTPSDAILVDENDEISPKAIDLAKERLSHSRVKHEFYLSTPTIPGYGIDLLYSQSDQRIWVIKCPQCNRDCCLERDFPECVKFKDGKAYRACIKCGAELNPSHGQWIPQAPSQSEIHGYHISQLCSSYIDPGEILEKYNDPPLGNLQEVYNSKLGLAYVSAENRLTTKEIYNICGKDPFLQKFYGPAAAGIDVGKVLHLVIGYRSKEKLLEIIYLARITSFENLHDICRRFNVRCAVIDMEPETRKVREWQGSENFDVWLCDYVQGLSSGRSWDHEKKILKVNRTESLDAVHNAITSDILTLPRRCEEIEILAQQCSSLVKVLEESEDGSREYRYRALAADHYFHSLNYFLLACSKISVAENPFFHKRPEMKAETEFNVFSYGQD